MTWAQEVDLHFGTEDPSGLGKIAKYHGPCKDRHAYFAALAAAFEHGFKTAKARFAPESRNIRVNRRLCGAVTKGV